MITGSRLSLKVIEPNVRSKNRKMKKNTWKYWSSSPAPPVLLVPNTGYTSRQNLLLYSVALVVIILMRAVEV